MTYANSVKLRKEFLKNLLAAIIEDEDEIIKALYKDFKKPPFESVITETEYVISDLKYTINKIDSWAKTKNIFPSLLNFPSRDFIYNEPYGKVLILSPWNYPFQLAICPLIAAVAAGNQVVLKPSELTPFTASLIDKIVSKTFHKNHVEVVLGDTIISQQLLDQRWDYIFFTGSVVVGKIVAKAAAKYLTPCTLELGGKNPCIIDETANLKLAAKRIVWGKFVNAGQTCIAPDYILVHSSVKQELVACLIEEITISYGKDPETTKDLARIINKKNWQRLTSLLVGNNIIYGGKTNEETFYIAPTLIDEPKLNHPIMEDEIFGPLLPIISYHIENDISNIISKYEKPLALYVFSNSAIFTKKIIQKYSFGGGCINDTLIHFANKRLPFGGVGHSGIGAYHGKLSFDLFSHKKAIVHKSTWLDIPFRYAPYKDKLNTLRKILKWL